MIGSRNQLTILETDLEAAITAGVIDRDAAQRLIVFATGADRSLKGQADEETLRLVSSFNDIFVTIGLALFLGALAYIVNHYDISGSALMVAVASWGLAEIFTRRKRLALPSIALLGAYSLAVFVCIAKWLSFDAGESFAFSDRGVAAIIAASGIATAGLVALHWLRFHVPITIAAGCAALATTVVAMANAYAPDTIAAHPILILAPLGLAVFGIAMGFDKSDRERITRRTDIAFWLHLLAAPMIVHPIVGELTAPGDMTVRGAGLILALFLVLSFVALVVDRRALLVSSLIYLGYASYTLLSTTSWAPSTFALAVLIVGAVVLILSVAWRPLRRLALAMVPGGIGAYVPMAA